MKLNGFDMELSAYSSEKLNDELVIYVEENKVICVLNQSAIIILDEISKCFESNVDCNSIDIVRVILQHFDVENITIEDIVRDVDETIELLTKASVIKFIEKSEKSSIVEKEI